MQNNHSIDKMTAGAHGAIDRAADTAASAADEAARMAKPAIDRTSQIAHQAVDKAAGVAVPTLDWLAVNTDRLKTMPGKFVNDGRQAVIDHPWQALSAALAFGLLVGRLLR
jgi:ElaB/YqjD/DUF883 family membrane-anchored ribosome-binding protein